MSKVYVTGNLICSECGKFLVPELVRDANDIPTGVLRVRKHKPNCSLYMKVATVEMAELKILVAVPECASPLIE
jgi:hypothetical protein